jgi:hypothetical protein
MGIAQPSDMITKNFSRSEVACKCGCGIDLISLELMCKLQIIRDQYFSVFNEGLILNCGCRCVQHNDEVGGKPDSAHLTTDKKVGEAVDISCTDSHKRFVLLSLLMVQFNRLEVGDVWLHADVAKDANHPQEVIFLK